MLLTESRQMCHEKNTHGIVIAIVVQFVHLFLYSTSKESNKCFERVEVDF